MSEPVLYLIRTLFAGRANGGKSGGPPADLENKAKRTEITPFFASIHSYVSLAEQLPLPRLQELLNAYFGRCVPEIAKEDGTVDKFVGDTVIAMFGAPIPLQDHGLRACVAALAWQRRIDELRASLARKGDKWPELARQLRARIGLHSGPAIVSMLGSETGFSYSMMGDVVNLASRVESVAKEYGVWTMCTIETKKACESADPARVVFRPLGAVQIAGRATPVELVELVALQEETDPQLQECLDLFASGLARWREHDWTRAIRYWEKSALLERNQPGSSPEIINNPSMIYLARARSEVADGT